MARHRLAESLLVASILLFPAPAFADHRGEPVYNIRYYADSNYIEEVGTDTGVCESYGIQYYRSGQATAYAVYEIAYWCEDGVWYPHH